MASRPDPIDGPDLDKMSTGEIQRLTKMMEAEVRLLKSERNRLWEAKTMQTLKLRENKERIKLYKNRPYLVSNVVEILDPPDSSELEELDEDTDSEPFSGRSGKTVIVKTSMRQVLYLPMPGIIDVEYLKPGDFVGVNKDSLLIIDRLPWEVDPRIKVMEISEKPTDSYTDIGGLDKQIQELIEAVVLPMTQKERFQKLGIVAPKGVLLYGPPGTGKTLLARACAAQTNAKFLKLAATQLVQMYIGDGAKMVRDAFQLARENAPAIIFIDEIDAIGTKRFDSAKVGDREVQRTMMELLNQLDGFTPSVDVKIIAATNRVDSLDPALIRSGRIDKKIEFPEPGEEARTRILHIHSRQMKLHPDVNLEEISKSTDGFNGAQCKAVCVEAGMISLRRGADRISHEDFMDAVLEVQAKKRAHRSQNMFA